jgi:single-strand DNA-binding protein
MERKMTELCEVSQIGRVGKIKEVGQNLLISIASDASYKTDDEWVDRTNWIEHTIFARQEGMLAWARENLKPGELVFVRSTPSQSSWEKDGEKALRRHVLGQRAAPGGHQGQPEEHRGGGEAGRTEAHPQIRAPEGPAPPDSARAHASYRPC